MTCSGFGYWLANCSNPGDITCTGPQQELVQCFFRLVLVLRQHKQIQFLMPPNRFFASILRGTLTRLPPQSAIALPLNLCLAALTQKMLQAGGNPGLIASAKEERLPDVSGEENVYHFDAPVGESFCKVLLLKKSMAPSTGKFTPALKFSASKKAVVATVRLPAGEGAPLRAWFDGILILLSVKDVKFAESSCSLKEIAQETVCKGNCESTISF